jgi:outer membrane protein OmpA-like peptidoglycan-associated protein
MNIKHVLTIILVIGMVGILSAGSYNHAASYIRMGLSARALGMGSAASASIDDVSAAYWNPAGLALVDQLQLASMYALNMGIDRTYNYVGLGFKTSFAHIGLTWVNANMTGFEGYDANANPTGSFDNNEHNIGLSLAQGFNRFRIGATAKMYLSNIDDDSESGYGVDVGMQMDLSQKFTIAVMGRDLIGELADDEIPYELSAGIAYKPVRGFTLASDVKLVQDLDPTASVGMEYWTKFRRDTKPADTFLSDMSAGFRVGLTDIADDMRITAGFGLGYRMIAVDYAFIPANQDFLDDSHRLSLRMDFGYERKREEKAVKVVREYEPAEIQPEEPAVEEKDPVEERPTLEDRREERRALRAEAERLTRETNHELQDSFELDSTVLKRSAYLQIDMIADFLNENLDYSVLIIGHACNLGSEEYNMRISIQRAQVIADYLVDKGIDPARIEVEGKGDTEPVASNETEEGRATNRRIEIHLID